MWKRITRLVSGERLDRQLNAEVTFHLDMEAEKYVRQGLDPEAARAEALKNFGPMARHVEETRDARGLRWLDDSLQDMRYAARTLGRPPVTPPWPCSRSASGSAPTRRSSAW